MSGDDDDVIIIRHRNSQYVIGKTDDMHPAILELLAGREPDPPIPESNGETSTD